MLQLWPRGRSHTQHRVYNVYAYIMYVGYMPAVGSDVDLVMQERKIYIGHKLNIAESSAAIFYSVEVNYDNGTITPKGPLMSV